MPRRKAIYSDLPRNFTINPITNDLNASEDERSINTALMALIDTPKGKIPFQEEFGCDISNSLFEIMSILGSESIRRSIQEAINNFEPRVDLQKIEVLPLFDENTYIVEIRYKMITDRTTIYRLKMSLRGEQ